MKMNINTKFTNTAKLRGSMYKRDGMSLLEVIIAIGLFMVIATASLGIILGSFSITRNSDERNYSKYYALEGLEAVKSIKTRDWEQLADGTYGLDNSSGQWELVVDPDTDGKYTRTVTIEPVYRDGSGNISEDPLDMYDQNVKKITVQVTWDFKTGNPVSAEYSTYVSYWQVPISALGSGMLVYSDGGDDSLVYRRYNDAQQWGAEESISDCDSDPNNILRRLEIYSSPVSEEKMLIIKIANSSKVMLCAAVWDGEDWGGFDKLVEHSDLTYEKTRDFDGDYMSNGDFVLVSSNATTMPQYFTWDTSSWSDPADLTADPLELDETLVWMIARTRPGTNEIMLVLRDEGQKTITYMWDGDSWGDHEEHASDSSGVLMENIAFTWRGNSDVGALLFNETDDNNPNIKIYRAGTGWQGEVENINVGGRARMFQITGNPVDENLLGCVQDSNLTINCMGTDYTPEWTSPKIRIASNTSGEDHRSFDMSYEMLNGEVALAIYSERTAGTLQIPKYRLYDPVTDAWSAEYLFEALGPTGDSELVSVRTIPKEGTDDILVMMGGKSGELATAVWNGEANAFYSFGGKGFNILTSAGPNDSYYWFDFEWDNVQ